MKALCALLLLTGISSNALCEKLITLHTREGVEQRFLLLTPESPRASVILFAGGNGVLGLSSFFGSPTIRRYKNNFLVRTRKRFVKQGLQVAVIDAPSDRQGKRGMLDGFRSSRDHVEDIDHVIRYLKERWNLPIWLVGTSRGTESAANLAIHSKEGIDGLVLTSSMSRPNRAGTAVTEMALEKIDVPTLIVAHSDDECPKTPPEGAHEISRRLTRSPKVEVRMFSGGDRPQSKPCGGRSYHGFLGLEEEVVRSISRFILSN